MKTADEELKSFLTDIRLAESDEQVQAIGNDRLSSLLTRNPSVIAPLLKEMRRNNRVRNAVSAGRYYTGLGDDICERLDAVLRAPFPGASGPRARPGRRKKVRALAREVCRYPQR